MYLKYIFPEQTIPEGKSKKINVLNISCRFSSYKSFTESSLKLYKEDPKADCPNPLISQTSMSVTSHNASEVCPSHDFMIRKNVAQ